MEMGQIMSFNSSVLTTHCLDTLAKCTEYHLMGQMQKLDDGEHRTVQRSPLFCAPGLVKFVTAVARLFCLALPWVLLKYICAE